jgi:PAS domain S-box-containing protein
VHVDHHKSLLNWNIGLAFGAAILALLVVGAISYRTMVVSRDSDRWVRHTHAVLENLQDLLIAGESIESSYRGFVLTGEQAHFASYRANMLSLERHETAVRNLTVDNPAQQRRISDVERLAAQEIQFVERVVALRRGQGFEAAADAIRTGPDQRVRGEFLEKIRELQQEELRLLTLRDADAKRFFDDTRAVLILGTTLGLLIAAAAAWSVQRDSSRRGLAEKALLESEEKYRGLLEAAPDAMVVVNQNGGIVLLNAQTENEFGYHRDELVGENVTNIIPEGFAERLVTDGTRTAAAAVAQQIGMGIELIGRRKNGTEFPIEITLSPLENAEGILVTAAIRNITKRKEDQKQLAETVGELTRSNHDLQQFANVASHDLQEPLRMVASYTELLARRYEGRLDADADEFIAYAVDGCNRMKRLIQDLLAYSRAGAIGKAPSKISGETSLNEALSDLRVMIEESGAVVTHDALPAITTDGSQLAVLFQNLVGNAIKYRGAEVPRVHVSAQKNGGNVWIFSVRDNGLGIDAQYFEKIFILFQRLHRQDEFKGTGIGLAICKKIVERLGGKIWVESQLHKGSTFYFYLPESDGK